MALQSTFSISRIFCRFFLLLPTHTFPDDSRYIPVLMAQSQCAYFDRAHLDQQSVHDAADVLCNLQNWHMDT